MIIDYGSGPPVAALKGKQTGHLTNYRRVYAASEKAAGRDSPETTLESYLATYDRLQARHVVVKARDLETTFGLKIRNEAVAAFCAEQGPRFIGFAGVDPHKGTAALRELEQAVTGLGLRGLNLQCFEHELCIDDRKLYPLYAKCVELGIPVNIHCGINFSTATSMEYGRPLALDRVMMDFPDLRVCASPPGWPWIHELIGVAWRHPNLWIGLVAVRPKYLAVAGSGYEPLLQYGRTVLKDRIVFGSAFPMLPVERSVEEIRALPLPPEVQERWLHHNAAAFLGLEPG